MNYLFPWNPTGGGSLILQIRGALLSAVLNSVNLAIYAATLIEVWRVLA